MLRFLIVLFLFHTVISVMAQNRQAAIWRYGRLVEMDFNRNPVKIKTPVWSDGSFGMATICDSNGVLQFLANGFSIRDRTDSLMIDISATYPFSGSGQWGCNIIIPFQNNPYKYHYFNIRDP